MIAVVLPSISSTTRGFRLLDTNSGRTIDISEANLKQAMKDKKISIENLDLIDGSIVGINGTIDRYTKCLPDNTIVNKKLNTVVVINRIEEIGFTISDYKGIIKKVRAANLVDYAKQYGIANGKLINAEGQTYVSSIYGNYPVITLEEAGIHRETIKTENKPIQITQDSENKKESEIDRLFNQTDKGIIARYIKHIQKNYKGNTEEINDICQKELNNIIKSKSMGQSQVNNSYSAAAKIITIMKFIESEENIKKIFGDEITDIFKDFLENEIPITSNFILMLYMKLVENKEEALIFIFGENYRQPINCAVKQFEENNKYSNLKGLITQFSEFSDNTEVLSLIAQELENLTQDKSNKATDVFNGELGEVEITPQSQLDIEERVLTKQSDTDSKLEISEVFNNNTEEITDKFELYKSLCRNNTPPDHIAITITNDIINRETSYEDLSRKQKYRVDQAIEIMQKLENKRLGKSEDTDSSNLEQTKKSKQSLDDEVNNTYTLDEHPEIRDKVNKLLNKADSVEMQAVLEKHPYVLKICYSILKYSKASDKQLKHINSAIEILNNQ